MNTREEVLQNNLTEFYWLAYVITGDEDRSVEAFARALGWDESGPGFREFMHGWVRRLVIREALETIRWELKRSRARTESGSTRWRIPALSPPPDLARLSKKDLEQALLEIDVFPRCAFVLTVLEGMPEEEVSTLLDADRRLVRLGKVQGAVELTQKLGRERPSSANDMSAPLAFPAKLNTIGNAV